MAKRRKWDAEIVRALREGGRPMTTGEVTQSVLRVLEASAVPSHLRHFATIHNAVGAAARRGVIGRFDKRKRFGGYLYIFREGTNEP